MSHARHGLAPRTGGWRHEATQAAVRHLHAQGFEQGGGLVFTAVLVTAAAVAGGDGGIGPIGLGHDGIGVELFGVKVAQLDELGAIDGQLQVKDVAPCGVEGHAPRFGVVQIGIHAQLHLFGQNQHLGLVLGDVGLHFTAHFAGEVAHHLVHQLAHNVTHLIRGVRAGQIVFAQAHVQQVGAVQLHGRLGRKVDDDQPGEAAIEQHEAANVGLEIGLFNALHHSRVLHLAVGSHAQHAGDGAAQADQQIVGAQDVGGVVCVHSREMKGEPASEQPGGQSGQNQQTWRRIIGARMRLLRRERALGENPRFIHEIVAKLCG